MATARLFAPLLRRRKYQWPVHSSRRAQSTQTSNPTFPTVVFSGIQPTGIPHLGNILGAFQGWVQLQQKSAPSDHLLFSIVGWHALTLPQDPKTLLQSKHDMLAALLAIGLNPDRCVIFHQDENPDHLELAWMLSCITPVNRLRRMTTWKARLASSRNANSESEIEDSMLNTGLFTYPVLQAADILAYRSTHVPVGEDQRQHLELARDLAQVFNSSLKRQLFPLPDPVFSSANRILSLRDPSSKMSKSSGDPLSRVVLTDSYEQIHQKIRGAVTDSTAGISFDPIARPGTSNLLQILAGCTGESVFEISRRYQNKGHGDLKNDVADAIEECLRRPRSDFFRLRSDLSYLRTIAGDGLRQARKLSQSTLTQVKQLVGLIH